MGGVRGEVFVAKMLQKIVSDIFEGLTKVMQHQKVYDALDGMMKQELHALSIKTYTSSQWDKSNMESN